MQSVQLRLPWRVKQPKKRGEKIMRISHRSKNNEDFPQKTMSLPLGVRYKLHHRGNGEPQLEFMLKLGQRAMREASREERKET